MPLNFKTSHLLIIRPAIIRLRRPILDYLFVYINFLRFNTYLYRKNRCIIMALLMRLISLYALQNH